MNGQQNIFSYVIPILIIGVVLFFRLRAMGRSRPLKLERLWIVPALYGALTIFLFVEMTPRGLGWLWAALALAAGSAIGWYRGTAMKIHVDPETHQLGQTASPLAMLVILGLIAIRFAIRAGLSQQMGVGQEGVFLATDCLVAFALGLLSMTRLEMYLRGHRLLAEARTNSI